MRIHFFVIDQSFDCQRVHEIVIMGKKVAQTNTQAIKTGNHSYLFPTVRNGSCPMLFASLSLLKTEGSNADPVAPDSSEALAGIGWDKGRPGC